MHRLMLFRLVLQSRRVDNSVLVKALDRFCQKLQAVTKMMPAADYSQQASRIVEQAARDQCAFALQALGQFFAERLTDVRHNLALPRAVGQDSLSLADLHTGLHNLILDHVRSLLRGLRVSHLATPGIVGK